MENINPERQEDHAQAVQALQQRLKDYLGLNTTYTLVTKAHPAITFAD